MVKIGVLNSERSGLQLLWKYNGKPQDALYFYRTVYTAAREDANKFQNFCNKPMLINYNMAN